MHVFIGRLQDSNRQPLDHKLSQPSMENRITSVMVMTSFIFPAVMVGDRYVVSGTGSISLNTTHPSPLDDGHLDFLLYLTPDLLPEREELLLPGPIEQETHIQVWTQNLPLCTLCQLKKWTYHLLRIKPWKAMPTLLFMCGGCLDNRINPK